MIKLYKMKTDQLIYDIMKQGEEQRDKQAIEEFNKQVYSYGKGWKIYKIRNDKNLPNNFEVTKKI